MRERSLMERLHAATHPPPPALTSTDASAVAESILTNLNRVLNERQGCCETRVDYGMPDFNDLVGQFPDAIPVVVRAVKQQITTFEPRLADTVVRHIPDSSNPLSLSFQITATVRAGDVSTRISFETVLGDDGYMRMRA
jgi:type VI secretion system protein